MKLFRIGQSSFGLLTTGFGNRAGLLTVLFRFSVRGAFQQSFVTTAGLAANVTGELDCRTVCRKLGCKTVYRFLGLRFKLFLFLCYKPRQLLLGLLFDLFYLFDLIPSGFDDMVE